VFVRGGDSALWYGRIDNGGAWSGWRFGGGVLASDPTAVKVATGIELFVRGANGEPYERRLTSIDDTSTGYNMLGGFLTSNMSATTTAAGVAVFGSGGDSAVYQGQLTSNAVWSGWQLAVG
jgi:hypothetical protein